MLLPSLVLRTQEHKKSATHKHGSVNWLMIEERNPITPVDVHQDPIMNVPRASSIPEPILGHEFIVGPPTEHQIERSGVLDFAKRGACPEMLCSYCYDSSAVTNCRQIEWCCHTFAVGRDDRDQKAGISLASYALGPTDSAQELGNSSSVLSRRFCWHESQCLLRSGLLHSWAGCRVRSSRLSTSSPGRLGRDLVSRLRLVVDLARLQNCLHKIFQRCDLPLS